MAVAPLEIDPAVLIDARDEVAVIRDLVVCLCLACSSPILPRDERTALCQLGMMVQERLDGLARSLEQMAPPVTFSGSGRT